MDSKHREKPSYDEPSSVAAEQGNVIVDGPDGVAVTMTPEAARETGRRLIDNGDEAEKQADDVSDAG
jgi:hypothetical protein